MLRIIYHTYNEEAARWTALIIFLTTTFVSITFSFLSGVFLLICYVSGYIICWVFLKNQSNIFSFMKQFSSLYKAVPQENITIKACSVCSNDSCKRHHHRSNPLTNLYPSAELNTAIEEFYNKILDVYVLSWYKTFSNDISFPNELRVCLRHTTATFLTKLLEFDVTKVLTTKLIPCAIKHVDDYMSIEQIAKIRNSQINEIAVDYFGKKLHIAATNRQNELNYVRSLTSWLLPHLVHEDCLNCKNFSVMIREIVSVWVLLPLMDFLANPHMINLLIILACTHKNKWPTIQSSEKVEFLYNFKRKYTSNSSFTCSLKDVLKSTELLYVFMQFLKKENAVHFLQFCLDIEEFNDKLLNPDLTKKELESIHESAQNLYKMYFDSESFEYIGCSQQIATEFKHLLQKGIYNIVKLRTSEPLYQAYDYAYSHLECEWLPLFFHSNEFYNHICGSKLTPTFSKASVIRSQRSYDSISKGPSKISTGIGKIKVALKPHQTIEGALYPQEHHLFGEKTAAYVEDVLLSDHSSGAFRDLNSWKVSITTVDMQQISSSKQIHFFNINVHCISKASENEIQQWTVRRKDEDFYNLKSKLVEFHGENEICNSPLPTRRFAVPVETRKHKYEIFLKSLLQRPNLRGSDLLFTFLTTEQDFTLFLNTTSNFPLVDDIGNIYQTFAFKIRKERGQHLDTFINTYLNSTGYSKSKFDWAEVGDEVYDDAHQKLSEPKPIKSSVFKNNFNLPDRVSKESSCTSSNPNGLTESLFYLFKHVFKVPQSVLKLYVAFCIVSQTTTEAIFESFVDYKIKHLLSESNIVHLIHILEDVIFENHPPQTEEELTIRKKTAFEELEKSVPTLAQLILGKNFLPGLRNLLDMLQNPLCNKQAFTVKPSQLIIT
ncbi:sorting nexin-14 isoform X2 [Agrilus planipennis]|uniref:Sorting nexin-14 isoform X2 n=1 Tax=Agrilus planipennis TaxID=224129 RepID=A0A7F5RB85_AGRPL|nr:sorting nexin-14 isoform X2 [Agrilus planipennis]